MMGNAYLITWNPKKWDFEGGYESFLKTIQSGQSYVEPWTVCSASINKGDVMYLMKLGGEPRGIIAKGFALDNVHLDKHYDSDLANSGVVTKHVNVQFEYACDFDNGFYIDWGTLKEEFPNQNWTPQSSGIRIKEEYIDELDQMWNDLTRDKLQLQDIIHNIVVIKINKTYRKGMSSRELYEFTRGFWKRKIDSVSAAEYALSVVYGEVVEVYKIDKWVHASQADNIIRKYDPSRHSDRIAFIGEVAPDEIRNYYIGKNVNALYKFGEADPIKLFLSRNSEDWNTNPRYESIMGSRNRERFSIDGTLMALIHRYPKYTLIYLTRHLSLDINEHSRMFEAPEFLNPTVEINPMYKKNNRETYYSKITFDRSVSIDMIKDTICFYKDNGFDEEKINIPLSPIGVNKSADGIISYTCGRCETEFVQAPRCPECGQLVRY